MDSEIRKLYKRWRRYREYLDNAIPWTRSIDQLSDEEIEDVINEGLWFDDNDEKKVKGFEAVSINLDLLGF